MNRVKGLVILAGLGMSVSALAQSTDQSRAYTNELLADANARTSQLALANGVDVGGFTQIRFAVSSRDQAPPASEDLTTGFSMRRTKLWFQSPVGDNEDWVIRIVGAFGSAGGGFVLDDAWVKHTFEEGWEFGAGQFKAPWLFEENTSSTKLLFADRSMFNEAFNQGRSQGLWIAMDNENFRFQGAITDGFASTNSEFGTEAADFNITVRGDFAFEGDMAVFGDATSWKGSEFAGRAGGAVFFQTGGGTALGTGGTTVDADAYGITIDGGVEGDGFNVFAAFAFVNTDVAGGTDADNMGIMVQGGWFASDDVELIAGLDFLVPDDTAPAPGDEMIVLRIGMNYYIIPNSHNAKLTAQINVALEKFNDPLFVASGGGAGVFGTGTGVANAFVNDPTGDPQIAFILQLQAALN